VVLLSGGGNFGDVWPFVQRHREWVLRTITDRRIVQLPQSLHFRDEGHAREVTEALARRDDVVLMWRDHASLAGARAQFPNSRSVLAPDVAYAGNPPAGVGPRGAEIVWVARDDGLATAPVHVGRRTDWRLAPRDEVSRQAIWLTTRLERRLPGPSRPRLRLMLYNRSARLTVAAAAAAVGSAGAVITDRLHAHVLCTMLGVPHVVVYGGSGKITAFVETWPVTHRFAHVAASVAEAEALARDLAVAGPIPIR
jgi:pyruvyl transferase EpsO